MSSVKHVGTLQRQKLSGTKGWRGAACRKGRRKPKIIHKRGSESESGRNECDNHLERHEGTREKGTRNKRVAGLRNFPQVELCTG